MYARQNVNKVLELILKHVVCVCNTIEPRVLGHLLPSTRLPDTRSSAVMINSQSINKVYIPSKFQTSSPSLTECLAPPLVLIKPNSRPLRRMLLFRTILKLNLYNFRM